MIPEKQTKGIGRKNLYFKDENISIYNSDILKFEGIPHKSIDLIVTSPPYNVDIDYGSSNDNMPYSEYLSFTRMWLRKCYDYAKDGGRLCLNVPLDKSKGGKRLLSVDIVKAAQDVGWSYRSIILWNQGNMARRTAWGSWLSAIAPNIITPIEVIIIFYKKSWKRRKDNPFNDITKEEFIKWTNGAWNFPYSSKKEAGGHPAPFPVELPRRCIKLFSLVGDTILDPFSGSGSTLIAAQKTSRKAIGVDIDKTYCNIAIERLCGQRGMAKLSSHSCESILRAS